MKKLPVILVLLVVATSLAFASTPGRRMRPMHQRPARVTTRTIIGHAQVRTMPAMTVAVVTQKAAEYAPRTGYRPGSEGVIQAYRAMMNNGLEQLKAWKKKNAGRTSGPAFSIYPQDPSRTPTKELTCQVGYPVTKGAKASKSVSIEQVPACTVAVVRYKGPYESSMQVWGTLGKWIEDNGYKPVGAPTEVFLRSPADRIPPDQYVTEIRLPVVKIPVQWGRR